MQKFFSFLSVIAIIFNNNTRCQNNDIKILNDKEIKEKVAKVVRTYKIDKGSNQNEK